MERLRILILSCILLTAFACIASAEDRQSGLSSLDQGGTYCNDATVIPGSTTQFIDTGFLDADDDCSNPTGWPFNDVFYTFTPTLTRTYIFRVSVFAPSQTAAIRIKGDACCAGGTNVASSFHLVSTDCDSGATTYLRALLTAGTQYWIHVGDSSTVARDSRYRFEMMYVACPDSQSTIPHNTFRAAQQIMLNDSIMGDSAFTAHPQWFYFVMDAPDSVIITEFGRTFGHCNSGFYPSCLFNPLNAHFVVYCDTFGHALYDANGELCSTDAQARLCLQAGTYWIKVENYGYGLWDGWNFILSIETRPAPGGCPPLPEICGEEETLLCPPVYDSLITLQPTSFPFPDSQHVEACVRLDTVRITTLVVPVLNSTNRPTVTVSLSSCAACISENCQMLQGATTYDQRLWQFDSTTTPPRFVNTIRAITGATGCCVCVTLDYILPVELLSYTPVAGDGEVTLNWATASEANNDHFELARDGLPLAVIRGAGTTSELHNYRYVDSGLSNGQEFRYTLAAVDGNGARTILGTVSARPESGPALITSYALYQNYPNPFNPTTQIGFDLVEGGMVMLTIYNLMGQEVASLINSSMNAGRHIVRFDATNLPSGIYLYRLTANGFVAEKKMLLMK